MAEALGALFSAVGVAASAQQLASSIFKIRRFCEEVKDAPNELRETLDQIENMGSIMARLARLEDTAPKTDLKDVFQDSVQLCRTTVERISTIAGQLEREMSTFRLQGSIKAVLKRRSLDKLLIKLDRHKADLHIVYSMYANACNTMEQMRLHKCIQAMREEQMLMIDCARTISTRPVHVVRDVDSSLLIRNVTMKKGRNQSRTIQIRLPNWLCEHAWDVAFERASGCWSVSLKSFRILEGNKLSVLCHDGDLTHIRHLLEARELSVHDQDERGNTAVSVAALKGHTALARYLIQHGAKPTWRPFRGGYSSIGGIHGSFKPAHRNSYLQIREHAQLLLDEFEFETADCSSNEKELEMIAKRPAVLTCEERLFLLQSVCRSHNEHDWDRFCELLPVDNVDPKLFHTRVLGATTLLHMLADFANWVDELNEPVWSDLVLQAARAHVDFNGLDDVLQTPFTTLLRKHSLPKQCEKAVRMWLACLARAQIDLQKYGSAERDHMRSKGDDWIVHLYPRGWEIFGFDYGPNPPDWRLWWRYPGDTMLEAFWSRVEDPEPDVPGRWIQDGNCGSDWQVIWALGKFRRRSGIKRKWLRRRKSESENEMHCGTYNSDTAGTLEELIEAVNLNAVSWKRRESSSNEAYVRLREVASLLGASRTDWRDGDVRGSALNPQG